MLLEKTEYDIIAQKLENDLNKRFKRIHWKVGDYDEQFLRATNSRDWWAWAAKQYEGFTAIYPDAITPEEAFESSMNTFRINIILKGSTEIDRRLITGPLVDAIPIVGEMVSCEIAELLLVK